MLKFIDLFCSIGGFHQAMNKLTIKTECVFACDIDKECRKIYHQNYGLIIVQVPIYDKEKRYICPRELCTITIIPI